MPKRYGVDGEPAPARFDGDYTDYLKVLTFVFVWMAAVIVVVSTIDGNGPAKIYLTEPGDARFGYTISLVLLALPLAFLTLWYVRSRETLQLKTIMKAVLVNVAITAVGWVLLDIVLANKLFTFPNPNAHLSFAIPGYSWKEPCATIWTLFNFRTCYHFDIPLEEVLFYLGGAALLTMMYMWGAEDFFSAYSLPRDRYIEQAKKVEPLVNWNMKLAVVGLGILVLGILAKKFAWWHDHHDGLPYYFFAELLIAFLPLPLLYNRVRAFTNTRAFLFVLLLQILVSVIWEATLALPYGWWDYQLDSMIGVVATPWSQLAIEACGLWVSVAWGVMLVYEATKIKALSGRTWPDVLFGRSSWFGTSRASERREMESVS